VLTPAWCRAAGLRRPPASSNPAVRRCARKLLQAVAGIHEIKFDGYRTQAHLRKGRPVIYTRAGHDWTLRFRTIADALATLAAKDLILDGEAKVAESRGIPVFGLLHADLAAAANLIYLDGFVMDEPSVPQASFLAGFVPDPRAPGTTPEWAAVRLL